jgi:sulfur carrier protein ThiS
MTVTFKIAAGFGHYLPDASRLIAGMSCATGPGDTVADLLGAVGFPRETAMLVFVNGRLADIRYRLNDGDAIFLAQTIAGG